MTALFPTTVVGSLPRPFWLKELFDDVHEGRVSAAEQERLLDLGVPSAIALQESAGVDVITDGEWRRFSYVAVITDVAKGFTRELAGARHHGKYWHTVTGEVEPGDAEPETIVARVEKAMEHVDRRRITLAPDCGFAPGNAADIPLDEAYAKLRNMTRAAKILRERHA